MKKRKIFGVLALVIVLGIVAFCGTIFAIYSSQTLSVSKLENHSTSLLIYDKDDSLLEEESSFLQVKIYELPTHVPMAFVAVEDKNFYKHKGISMGRIVKAAFINVKAGRAKEGASTISQQLIKNTHLSHEKTMQRKIREASLAHKLERKYSKDGILEMYLNVVYFGNGIYGLGSAAQFYFSKPASELTMREAASLASMLKSPGSYCPITKYDRFSSRGVLVLGLMREQDIINSNEFEIARNEEMKITADKRPNSIAKSYRTATAAEAAKVLDLSASDLAAFGYKVYTYYDEEVQKAIIDTVTTHDYDIKTIKGKRADSVVIASSIDGEVRGFYTSHPSLINARRNFASAMKPLTVYAPAIELGVVSPSTFINDEPYAAGNFHPKNHDGKYRGPVSVRESLAKSHNVPAVKVLEYTGLDKSIEIAKRIGITSLGTAEQDENMSLALGNTAGGVSFNELVDGYSTLANEGTRTHSGLIRIIKNRNDKVVWQHRKGEKQAIGDDTAYLVTDMLQDAVKTGTAKKLDNLPFDVAAKTGTAERGGGQQTNTDAVCVAYTDNNVLIVWHGNASMKIEDDLAKGTTGGGKTTFVTKAILEKIESLKNHHHDKQNQVDNYIDYFDRFKIGIADNGVKTSFKRPASVGEFEFDLVDAKNGKLSLVNEMTPHNQRMRDVFANKFAPKITSSNFLSATPVTVDGKISDNGLPLVWFNTLPHQTYEIYKNNILQEVIKGKEGEYLYFDKNSKSNGTSEYYVTSRVTGSDQTYQSNNIKIMVDGKSNKNSKVIETKRKDTGRQWFF